ncbi:50S ribosomal protein L13 [Limnochorda pilosa]|uniref:Large ribosomal subunit protein uL13 n=1 Tax=Limnochorda pilosa TaxID=1555112 RepID=A0A0K2SPJ3_LIMPI|nr:50S ribosomal protein L13 [Limnochorda pilosa]BAS29058.1 50S ribosomal protein L13 [Limnochorda pilosa]
MQGLSHRTRVPKADEIEQKWYVVDARGQVVGRLASRIATILRGKHKPSYTPHLDTGDYVIVVNAAEVALTGKKWEKKVYSWHSGYPGGLKQATAAELRRRHPEAPIERAVWGMLPHNRLGRQLIKKLKVYAGPDHPHQAQNPEPLQFS